MKRGAKIKKKSSQKKTAEKVKSRKKGFNKNTLFVLMAIFIVIILMFVIIKNMNLTSKVIEKPQTPTNCSNESIKAVWESIFKGSSENLIIVAPNESLSNETEASKWGIFTIAGCPVYTVYRINGNNVKMLLGVNLWFFMDTNLIMGINGDFKPEAMANLTNLLNQNDPESVNIGEGTFLSEEFVKNNTIPRNLSTVQEAQAHFESIFNITSSNWIQNFTEEQNLSFYYFAENETLENITLFGKTIDPLGIKGKTAMLFRYYGLDSYFYLEMSMFGMLEAITKEFENWTSPINTSLENITIKINDSELDILGDYNGLQKLEILENNQTIIEAEVNLDNFDFTKIILKKQDNSSNKGYVIINGLNVTKNITVDKLNPESESVCIKDAEVNSISEITEDCSRQNEYIVECPGGMGNFSCTISGNKFIVKGLTHSAVVEILLPEEPCIPDWECDYWTNYEKDCGYRTCIDLNNCGNITGKPEEYKQCPVCIPNWDCTEFLPEKCPKSETRTRTCADLNECGTLQERPSLKETCERKNSLIWILIGVIGGIIILLILIAIIRKNQEEMPPEPAQPNQNYPDSRQPPTKTQQQFYPKQYPLKIQYQQNQQQTYTPQRPNPQMKYNPNQQRRPYYPQ